MREGAMCLQIYPPAFQEQVSLVFLVRRMLGSTQPSPPSSLVVMMLGLEMSASSPKGNFAGLFPFLPPTFCWALLSSLWVLALPLSIKRSACVLINVCNVLCWKAHFLPFTIWCWLLQSFVTYKEMMVGWKVTSATQIRSVASKYDKGDLKSWWQSKQSCLRWVAFEQEIPTP